MNIERFKRVLRFIQDNPSHWDQELPNPFDGPCCFLGHACRMSRRQVRFPKTWTETGAEWLELSPKDQAWIFKCSRTMKDFRNFLRNVQRRKAA